MPRKSKPAPDEADQWLAKHDCNQSEDMGVAEAEADGAAAMDEIMGSPHDDEAFMAKLLDPRTQSGLMPKIATAERPMRRPKSIDHTYCDLGEGGFARLAVGSSDDMAFGRGDDDLDAAEITPHRPGDMHHGDRAFDALDAD